MTKNFAAAAARLALAMVVSGAVLTTAVVPAMAAEPLEVYQTRDVNFGDLDLTQPAGQAMLQHRLAVAARKLCRDMNLGSAPNPDLNTECYATSFRQAWAEAQIRIAAAVRHSMIASAGK